MTNQQEFIFGIYVGVGFSACAVMLFVLCRTLYRMWRESQVRDAANEVMKQIKKGQL